MDKLVSDFCKKSLELMYDPYSKKSSLPYLDELNLKLAEEVGTKYSLDEASDVSSYLLKFSTRIDYSLAQISMVNIKSARFSNLSFQDLYFKLISESLNMVNLCKSNGKSDVSNYILNISEIFYNIIVKVLTIGVNDGWMNLKDCIDKMIKYDEFITSIVCQLTIDKNAIPTAPVKYNMNLN